MKNLLMLVGALVLAILAVRFFAGDPAPTNARPVGETIICFGDSLTFGTGARPEESYPSRLAALMGTEVVNAGIPGDTTADALRRLDRDVLSQNPRIVLITLGGNDLMRDVPPDVAYANLEQIVERIHAQGTLVVVGGINVPLFDKGFDRVYESLRDRTNCLLIPNVLKGLIGRSDLMSDRIHPNAAGYEIMAGRFYDAVQPYVNN